MCQVCGRTDAPGEFIRRRDLLVCRDSTGCADRVFNPPSWSLALLTPDGVEVHRVAAHTETTDDGVRVVPDDDREVSITATVDRIVVYTKGTEFACVPLHAIATAGCTLSTMTVNMGF